MGDVIGKISDFFLSPLMTFFNYLTSPDTLMSLTKKISNAMGSMDEFFYSYSLPAIFYYLGIFFLLMGLVTGLLKYLRGGEKFTQSLLPPLIAASFFPLFAYPGPGCEEGGFPCVPNMRYEREEAELLHSRGTISKLVFNSGRLTLETENVDMPKETFYVLVPVVEGDIPLGTAILLGLSERSNILGRQIFYGGLANTAKP